MTDTLLINIPNGPSNAQAGDLVYGSRVIGGTPTDFQLNMNAAASKPLSAFLQPSNSLSDVASVPTACANLGVWNAFAKSAVQSSHTGDTSLTTLASITVPAGAMGANGFIRLRFTGGASGTNTKTWTVTFGGVTYTAIGATTQLSVWNEVEVGNRNAANSQVGHANGQTNWSTNASGVVTSAVDTTSSQLILIKGQLTNSGETITVESYIAELSYGA